MDLPARLDTTTFQATFGDVYFLKAPRLADYIAGPSSLDAREEPHCPCPSV